jgi:hypothetical protein
MGTDETRSLKNYPALATRKRSSNSRLLRWFRESALFLSSPDSRQQLQKSLTTGRSGAGLASVGSVLLLLWNAKLVFSTGVGIGTMMLMYLLQDAQWRREKLPQVSEKVQAQFEGLNRPFLWSTIGGGSAAFLSYLAISAWTETDSHWLATGLLLQGLMTFGVLGLALRQVWGETQTIETIEVSHWVETLSHSDPIQRLLAVRQLTKTAESAPLIQQKEILEYFQLMVSREPEELVREAVWQALETLMPTLNHLANLKSLSDLNNLADLNNLIKTDDRIPVPSELTQAKIKAWVEH